MRVGASIKGIYDEGRSIVYFPSSFLGRALLSSSMSAEFVEHVDVKARMALQSAVSSVGDRARRD